MKAFSEKFIIRKSCLFIPQLAWRQNLQLPKNRSSLSPQPKVASRPLLFQLKLFRQRSSLWEEEKLSFCFCFLSFPPQMLFALDFVKVGLTQTKSICSSRSRMKIVDDKYLSFTPVVVIVAVNQPDLEWKQQNWTIFRSKHLLSFKLELLRPNSSVEMHD